MTHEFGKGGQEALDAHAIHFDELTGDEWFGTTVGEDGGGEDYHGWVGLGAAAMEW